MRYGVYIDRQLYAVVNVFFQAEDGRRDLVRSRGLGDVYRRQPQLWHTMNRPASLAFKRHWEPQFRQDMCSCHLYTSDAADDLLCVDLGGSRIIKKTTQVPANSLYDFLALHPALAVLR